MVLGPWPLEPTGFRIGTGRHSREAPTLVTQAFSMQSLQVVPDKAALRRSLRQKRAALDETSRRTASLQVMLRVRSLRLFRRGSNVAIYVPMGSELSTWPLIFLAIKTGCRVFLPETPKPGRGRRLRFVRLDENSRWASGAFGIPVPVHKHYCAARDLDIVFLPLLGFDENLGRLGQGGGYYDTTFHFRRMRKHWLKPRLVGLAYECQKVAVLPLERWDLRLDQVFTESHKYNARST